MSEATKFVILGGSGASTPELGAAIAAWPTGLERRPPLEVTLYGRSADKLAVVGRGFGARLAEGDAADVRLGLSNDLAEALDGAGIVLVQVRVGGLDARAFDETFPRRFGLPGEETMGPGGFANAVRTVPALRPTWEAIARYAPTAKVIVLTNPAGIVLSAAVREFAIDAVEVCDSPVTLVRAIADRLGRPWGEVAPSYIGANHLGWWVAESEEQLAAVADLATGFTPDEVLTQGALPGPYVRYAMTPDRLLASQGTSQPRAEELKHLEQALLSSYRRVERPTPDRPQRGAVWYSRAVLPYVEACIRGSREPLIVGQVVDRPFLGAPSGVVVEHAVVQAASPARPQSASEPVLPPLAAALVRAQLAYESLTVEALSTGSSRRALVRALAANPMVRDLDRASALVDEILARSPG